MAQTCLFTLEMAFPFPSLLGKKHFSSILFKFGIIRALILKSEPSWDGYRAVVCAESCGFRLHSPVSDCRFGTFYSVFTQEYSAGDNHSQCQQIFIGFIRTGRLPFLSAAAQIVTLCLMYSMPEKNGSLASRRFIVPSVAAF